jgi:hypothetical protein
LTPLEDIGITGIPARSLQNAGILYAEQAAANSDEYLLGLKGVSKATVDKIRQWAEAAELAEALDEGGSEAIMIVEGPSPVDMAYDLMSIMVRVKGVMSEDYAIGAWSMVRAFLREANKGLDL